MLAVLLQGDAKAKAKAESDKQEAAKKEIAELMAKAKADMEKEDKASDAQADADDLKKQVSSWSSAVCVPTADMTNLINPLLESLTDPFCHEASCLHAYV